MCYTYTYIYTNILVYDDIGNFIYVYISEAGFLVVIQAVCALMPVCFCQWESAGCQAWPLLSRALQMFL